MERFVLCDRNWFYLKALFKRKSKIEMYKFNEDFSSSFGRELFQDISTDLVKDRGNASIEHRSANMLHLPRRSRIEPLFIRNELVTNRSVWLKFNVLLAPYRPKRRRYWIRGSNIIELVLPACMCSYDKDNLSDTGVSVTRTRIDGTNLITVRS